MFIVDTQPYRNITLGLYKFVKSSIILSKEKLEYLVGNTRSIDLLVDVIKKKNKGIYQLHLYLKNIIEEAYFTMKDAHYMRCTVHRNEEFPRYKVKFVREIRIFSRKCTYFFI